MIDKTLLISEFPGIKVFVEKEDMLKSEHTVDNKLHTHTEYEMLINLKGDEHVIVEKNIYPITRGDVILVHPHEQHHCVLESENKHSFFWILIDAPKESPIAKFLDGLKSNYYSPENENKKILIELCEELISTECQELDTLRILLEILNLLKKTQTTHPKHENKLPGELNDVLDYIDSHYSEELKIKAVARELGLSESTLTRRFKEFLGATPIEYLQKKRMIKAAELLQRGESVLEVGLAVGYSDNSYFIKLFKSYYGVTPLKYKEKFK